MGILATSCTNFFLIKWVANVLGVVMRGLYIVSDAIGIANIGLCIILFTVIIKLLMLPLTIKQQRFSKLSSMMNPEIQAIQKKYKNKKDQDSMMKMQEETTAVYQKYGTSPTGGCLQLIIQMPILFALYSVIYSVPTYVPEVNNFYQNVSESIASNISTVESIDEISKYVNGYYDDKDNYDYNYISDTVSKIDASTKDDITAIVSAMTATSSHSAFSESDWTNLIDTYKNIASSDGVVSKLKGMSEEDWDKIATKIKEQKVKDLKDSDEYKELVKDSDKENKESETEADVDKLVNKFKNYSDEDWNKIMTSADETYNTITDNHDHIKRIYRFAGLDLTKSPSSSMADGAWWALLIPILSALLQWYSTKLISSAQNMDTADNLMGSSMKIMNMTMPLMSAFFCFSLPAALGIYWVASSLVQIISQIAINKYFNKVDVNDIIKENIEKANKKRAKKGLPPQKITNAATTNAKSISTNNSNNNTVKKNNSEEIKKSTDYYKNKSPKAGSLASKANMVKMYDDKSKK